MTSDEIQELIDLINEGEENEMSTISERIAAEFKNERVIGRREGKEEGIIEGKKEGKEEGIIEGKKEGIKEGEKKSKIAVIKNMILLNLDSSLIQKVTGEKAENIEKIRQEISVS
jgi:predicted transposase YdaD